MNEYFYDFLDKYDFLIDSDGEIFVKGEAFPHLGVFLNEGIKNKKPPAKWVKWNAVNVLTSLLEFFYNKRVDCGFDASGRYFDFIQDFFGVEIITTDHCGVVVTAYDAWLNGVIGLEFLNGVPRIWHAGEKLNDLEVVEKNAKVVQVANFLASVGGGTPSLLPDLNPQILQFISICCHNDEDGVVESLLKLSPFIFNDKEIHELRVHSSLYLNREGNPIKRNYAIPQFVWYNQTDVFWKRQFSSFQQNTNESTTCFISKDNKEYPHILKVVDGHFYKQA